MSIGNVQLASSIAKNYTGSVLDLIKTEECTTNNDYLIATANRNDHSYRMENIHQTQYMVSKYKARSFQAKHRFGRVNGRLPMNMILSQAARREDSINDTVSVISAEKTSNRPVFEDCICTHALTKKNIKPWRSKPLKTRNKVNRKVFIGPNVTEFIQDRYFKLYRNEAKGKLLVSKCPKETAVNRDIDENPIEGDEFPNAYCQPKMPKLHVRWEDESPMGHGIAVSEVFQNADNARPNYLVENSPLLKNLYSPKISKSLPSNHSFSRYNELYSEIKLPNKSSSSYLTKILQDIGNKDNFPEESVGKINMREKGFLDDNTYSTENCFLQTINGFKYPVSPDSIIYRQEYEFSKGIPNNMHLNENNSLRLSADLFESVNSDAESITGDICKSYDFINFESLSKNLSQEDDAQITKFENQNCEFFSELKSTPIFYSGRKNCNFYLNEGENASPEGKQRKCYISDPDDLLRTP